MSLGEESMYAKHYYTPHFPSAFGGSKALKTSLKAGTKKGKKIDKWLSGQETYTLHRPIKYKFQRRKTITPGKEYQLQADLIDVRNHSDQNDGNNFILTVIDVFSKKAWAIPIKNKTGLEVVKALKPILEEVSPSLLQTDKGKEFLNVEVQQMMKKVGVKHFTTENENIKASIVERFNKTLRNTLHRYFTKSGRERYVDVINDVVKAYNNRFHNSIGMSPNEVTLSNQEDVWLRLYDPVEYFEKKNNLLNIGDSVRITKTRTAFQRGYTPNWSIEIFKITNILNTTPTTYRLKDWHGEEIKGSFYAEELQKVQEPEEYKIEKIIDKKKIGRRNMVLVKWLGYSDEFNQWIPESDIRDLV